MPEADAVSIVRRFSRLYTRRLGLLHEGLLGSALSLPEGRLVYELAQREATTAAALAAGLGLDPGYLSRLVRGLEARGLVARQPSPTDARKAMLSLTEAGQEAFAAIDARSRDEVAALLAPLPPRDRARLAASLMTAERLLGGEAPAVPYLLRPPRSGDFGWVVHRHGALYAQEYGWDETFEALVAEIVAGFIRDFDPRREQCWIAEREGGVVGSVFVVRESDTVAKLRLLYVEPTARGLGIGRRLVEECIRFARQAGYARMTLWTNDVLTAARHIYQATGFRLVRSEPHRSFGHDLVGEFWERDLAD